MLVDVEVSEVMPPHDTMFQRSRSEYRIPPWKEDGHSFKRHRSEGRFRSRERPRKIVRQEIERRKDVVHEQNNRLFEIQEMSERMTTTAVNTAVALLRQQVAAKGLVAT